MLKILVFGNNLNKKNTLNLKDAGGNYGNLCFYYGCLNIFKKHEIYFLDDNIDKPDFIVVSIANSICNIKSCINYMVYICNSISKFSCKKILLSIGAQNNDLSLFSLKDEYKISINNFFKQFDFINLRGTYTRDLLIYNNIKYNYHVLGCPSIILCNPITNIFSKAKMNLESKILFNSPRIIGKNTQPNCDFIFNLIKDSNLDFLNQDFIDTKKKNINVPKNFIDWKKIVKKYDFVIGTRIHGAIMALICNIPTLLIVMDSRTYELAEIFKIPYINIIDKGIDLKNKSDVVKLINSYTFNFDNYNNYLEEYKKNIKLKLLEPFNL